MPIIGKFSFSYLGSFSSGVINECFSKLDIVP